MSSEQIYDLKFNLKLFLFEIILFRNIEILSVSTTKVHKSKLSLLSLDFHFIFP